MIGSLYDNIIHDGVVDTTTITENSALSLSTSGQNVVDFFFKTVRDIEPKTLEIYLNKSWNTDPLTTLKLIFIIRDCRQGKGERDIFENSIRWMLRTNKARHIIKNLEHIPFYGSYKDLLKLLGTVIEPEIVRMYCEQLKKDYNTPAGQSISLAAKWAPSEGCMIDNNFKAVRKFTKCLGVTRKTYRKEYLTKLRERLDIVERKITSETFSEIDYSKTPSLALHRYEKLFKSKDPLHFDEYIVNVKKGSVKINASVLYPYQIVKNILSKKNAEIYDLQWKNIVETTKNNLKNKGFKNFISIVDVSGSMDGLPMEVAISLGIILSEISEGFYKNKLITFSEDPLIFNIPSGDIVKKVQSVSDMNWGTNTNLQKVFDLILTEAIKNKISNEDMPKKLFIFSDMQFDIACSSNSRTNFQEIEDKYTKHGYTRPHIIFWNLRANTLDFPVSASCPNTSLVSGFSPSLFKLFIEEGEISPVKMIYNMVNDERYSRISLAEN